MIISIGIVLVPANQAGAENSPFLDFKATTSPVNINTSISPVSVRPGENVRVVVSVNIEKGWHIYSLVPGEDPTIPPTKVKMASPALIVKSPVYETNPIIKFDPVIGAVMGYHKNQVRFYQNFKVSKNPEIGKSLIKGFVKYQVCNAQICLLPTLENIEVQYTVKDLPIRPEFSVMNRSIDSFSNGRLVLPTSDSMESALSKGFWAFILLAAIMGMAAWLTPCVFPMIPITISYFSKQSHGNPRHLYTLAVVFVSGIIITYTGLGFLISALFGATAIANLATSPWTNIGIALLFFVFALNLMGFLDFKLPFGLSSKVDRLSRQKSGFLGVILMGTAFTLTAFTCTMPFVGTLLVAAAQGELLWPVVGMFVFSIVFALPFLILALFPRWGQAIKYKAGSWMLRLKFSLGLLELIAVTKFLSNADLVLGLGILNRQILLGIWTILVLSITVVMWGTIPFPGIPKSNSSTLQRLTATLFLFGVFYLGYGLTGKTLDGWTESYLPPVLVAQSSSSPIPQDKLLEEEQAKLNWIPDLEKTFEIARKKGKPIFVDFTGYTCVNCRWMEQNTFRDPQVHSRLKNRFILVRLYTDGGEGHKKNQELQVNRFKTIALPLYVILSSGDQVLAKSAGISYPDAFTRFLDSSNGNKDLSQ